jgi:hypothetical protein
MTDVRVERGPAEGRCIRRAGLWRVPDLRLSISEGRVPQPRRPENRGT